MKIVVFDDDPTGSQTVYDCPLLLDWNLENLRKGIKHSSPLLFILGNTRSITPELANNRLTEICRSFKKACQMEGLCKNDFLFVSRGDSTLRGHGFLEPSIINKELGPFDATFHVPAFLEGGRQTVNGIHFLNRIPVHKTIYAKDKIFGFSNSNIASWLEEKSNGKILSSEVLLLDINLLNAALENAKGMEELLTFLLNLSSNRSVVVDAEKSCHLEVFSKAIKALTPQKNFLFRSGASLLNRLAALPPQNKSLEDFVSLRLKDNNKKLKPGLILVGSHVQLADLQLHTLLKDNACSGLELSVKLIADALYETNPDLLLSDLHEDWLVKISNILDDKKTPVIYTTRGEVQFLSFSERMKFGLQLANIIALLIAEIVPRIGYIISKGGITTQMLLSKGLNAKELELKGQIIPGLSVVLTKDSCLKNDFPILTLPGNLGDESTLLHVWKLMEN